MGMTLDEAIKHAEEVADHCEAFENQERVHDVRWMSRSRCAKEHRQLAKWLKDYKLLLERESCEDAISREDALMALTGEWTESRAEILPKAIRRIKALPSVNPQEPILDKIIADIGGALSEEALDDNRQQISDVGIGLEIALSIIDKYKAEDA